VSYRNLILERKERIAWLTLNRAEAGNALNLFLANELEEACRKIGEDDEIWVVVLTGAGEVFCRGNEPGELIRGLDELELLPPSSLASRSIASLSTPVIVALNGDALGGGLELALAGDIRLAAKGTKFGFPEISEGLIPGGGGTQRLPRIVGRGKALELILTGDLLSAEEAHRLITLNRPKQLNTVNVKMRDELYELLPAVQDDPEVVVCIVKGAGERAFSAGADITEFGTAPSQVIARQVHLERELWRTFLNIDKPLIAAIHGFAIGAGIEMAMCCDIRLASDDARFGLPEINLGMIPPAGGTQLATRLLGVGKASRFILTGDLIDAQEAWRLGLINRVVPRDQLLVTARALAQKLASWKPLALRLAKRAIVQGLDLPLEEGLRLEARLLNRLLREARRFGY